MVERLQKVLTDVRGEVYDESWSLCASDLGHHPQPGQLWSVDKFVLRGGRQDGVDVVDVDNGTLRFRVLPTRGMGIQEATYDDIRLGWDSPAGEIVHPKLVRAEERGGLGWLAGFSEWVARCGTTSNGAPCLDYSVDNQGRRCEAQRTLHGRVANTPASFLAVTVDTAPPHAIRVYGVVIESGLFLEHLRLETCITTEPGANWICIEDQVTNCRSVPQEMQMLYHVNYGPPLLEPGSRALLAAGRISPRDTYPAPDVRRFDRYGEPTPGKAEQVFFADPKADRAGRCVHGLRNAAGDLAVSHICSRAALPCVTLWKNEAGIEDGYVTGIEPATNYPNPIAFERKKRRVRLLKPGRSWRADLLIGVHVGRKAVRELERRIKAIQGRNKPELLRKPAGDMSSGE